MNAAGPSGRPSRLPCRGAGASFTRAVFLQLFNVAKLVKPDPFFTSAALVAAAVIVQVALGIWTLLSVAALPLALVHQASAMITGLSIIRFMKAIVRSDIARKCGHVRFLTQLRHERLVFAATRDAVLAGRLC